MNLAKLKILSNHEIATNIFQLEVFYDNKIKIQAGQFAMLKVAGKYLKRPLSISSYDDKKLIFIYKVFGEGTQLLSQMKENDELEILYPLGNGFTIKNEDVAIIAGGIGVAPMHNLAIELSKNNKTIEFYLGFKTKDEVFLVEELKKYGTVHLYTEDGSLGKKGYCLEPNISSNYYLYGCGPHKMLTKIANLYENAGELSTEEYMACGFGICSGCSIKLKSGMKKVCSDGPVFAIEEFDVN